MTQKELMRLRDLAKLQAEIAHSPKMDTLRTEWTALNDCRGDTRPMITVELGTFAEDILPALMQCETEEARRLEWMLLSNTINHTHFGDDTFVRDHLPVTRRASLEPFGLPVKVERTAGLGHYFVSQIFDLEEDFHKLQPSPITIEPLAETQKRVDALNEIFGDILPAKITGQSLYVVPTQNIVHLMSMEDMYVAMYDAPELFHRMMDLLADDYIRLFDRMEQENCLLPTVSSEGLGQGTYCFTTELPEEKVTKTTQIWGFMDSQETAGISPAMFEEFIFPYYKKVFDRYGLFSYGCCEAVDPIWENCLSKAENLRKVSISPWCNEEFMGERLRGRKTVYHRKPSPNFLGVGNQMDEEALRQHIRKTVQAARGCTLEITQRDVYQVSGSIEKVRRYVEILREQCADF
ncbi:MAG: hypothetical protein IJF56_02125 [Clostridia bacterium]|nr:hypothetical protein [Clostridia bacterium]